MIFVVVVVRSSNSIYDTLTDSFISRFRAQALAENLEQLRHDKLKDDQRMQGIMDYAPTAIYVKDLEGRFIFLNQKVADLQGMKREEIIGKTLRDILPAEIADAIHENDLKVIEVGKPLEYEESAPQDDGLHHFISIKFPLFDENEKIYAVGGISTDITERVRIEESLRISQQRLLLHRELSPVGLIEWNTDFEFIDWNPAAEKIFGFTKEEVAGRHITERILPDTARPTVNKIWEDLIANRGGIYSLNENITKDGRTILCEWHNTPLVDHTGKVIGVTSLVEDVTERQRNEDTLRHSQKMDAIGKLTGGIAHDFNNMLAVVLGFSDLLKGHAGDDQQLAKYVDEIINAGERAKKLTSKLLEFSHKAPSSKETCYINELLQGMQHMLEKTLTIRINLVLALEENLWPVWLDKARLEDAVLNVCINSMHAMPDGGTLTLSARNIHFSDLDAKALDIVAGDYVTLTISDTGVGMSREIQQKMFDPFFTTKGESGTGLGLSQVYGFVQQSGGKVQVYSEPEYGTRISIYFPRYQLDETAEPDLEVAVPAELPAGSGTILVVDDEVSLSRLMEEILTGQGYDVLCAGDAQQALEILKNNSVDLMISDVLMPGMDGYQLATEVEKHYPTVKIQMVSGFSDGRKAVLSNGSLHQQRLSKPVGIDVLLRRVKDLLDA